MTFHDIFSKKKLSTIKQTLSPIIVDIHEKNSLVTSELSALKIPFEFQHLEVADYLINNIAIERKTISDLKSSIINKRIFDQLSNLKQHASFLLIIEGIQEELYNNKGMHENAVRGFLLSLTLDKGIPFILTENSLDTAHYLSLLAKRTSAKIVSLRPSRIFASKEKQLQFILEGFPGIGPVAAQRLLTKFSSLHAIFSASLDDLGAIIGKKADAFHALLHESY